MTPFRLNMIWSLTIPAAMAIIGVLAPAALGAGKTITVDGSISEWDPGDILYADAEISDGNPTNSSYVNVYVANDTDNLYFGLETKGSGGGSILNLWTHNIYVDIDTNAATGYNGGIWAGGYDRQVRYGDDGFDFDVYQFTGGINQSTPSWGYLSFVTYAFSDSFIEIAVSLTDLGLAVGDSARIQLVVSGGVVTVDTLAHATEASAKSYTLEDTTLPAPLTVILDGDLSEWGPEYVVYIDSEIGDGLPLNSTYSNIYAANDFNNLYFGFEVKGSGGGEFTNDWRRQVLIDTDNNPATGFNGDTGWMAHGYDRLVEWGAGGLSATVNSFTGLTQNVWAWGYEGPLSFGYSSDVIEFGVSRGLLDMGVNDQAVLEFVVTDGSVSSQTWAHVDEAQAETYTFVAAGNVVPVSRTIKLDGDLSDWGPEFIFYNDGEIEDGLPTNSTYDAILAANDEDFLYIGYDTKGSGGGQWTNGWVRDAFIDSDNSPATGAKGGGGWMVHGYDRRVSWGLTGTVASISSYTGTNQAEWSEVEGETWTTLDSIDFGFSDNEVELGVPRALLGMGTNNLVVMEFRADLGPIPWWEASWAHEFETEAKDYVFTTRPSIDAMSIAGGMVQLDISGLLPGSTVTVHQAVTLEPPGWTGTNSFISTGTSTNWSGPLGGFASESFRVRRDGP